LVVRAPSVLGSARATAFVALAAALLVYYYERERLPVWPLWFDVAFAAIVLIPAVLLLVWLALPLRRAGDSLLVAAAAGAVLAFALDRLDQHILSNFVKLALVTALGWWVLRFFEEVSWAVLIAAIIPVVDSISVWRGPTHHIVTHSPNVFSALSFAFPVPGRYEPGRGAFHLGLPDLLFFALFLGAAARWRLRTNWTWLGMAASFGLTLTLAKWRNVDGLPALPLLSAGFLLPNADLLWTRLRRPARTA
jgi:uncharacterized membrane protein YjjB (DUF3815 family)